MQLLHWQAHARSVRLIQVLCRLAGRIARWAGRGEPWGAGGAGEGSGSQSEAVQSGHSGGAFNLLFHALVPVTVACVWCSQAWLAAGQHFAMRRTTLESTDFSVVWLLLSSQVREQGWAVPLLLSILPGDQKPIIHYRHHRNCINTVSERLSTLQMHQQITALISKAAELHDALDAERAAAQSGLDSLASSSAAMLSIAQQAPPELPKARSPPSPAQWRDW